MSKDQALKGRIQDLKAVIFDCDGIMTNGQIFYNGNGQWVRFFNILDGMGVKRLQKAGLQIGMITNSDSDDIRERCKNLGIEDLYDGASNKVECLKDVCSKWGLNASQVAYMGDDLQDIPVLQEVGFAVSVPHALSPVKQVAHLVTEASGGFGAVRELCELILEHQQ